MQMDLPILKLLHLMSGYRLPSISLPSMVRTESPASRERTVSRDRQEAKVHPEIPVRMESPEKMARPEPPELPAEAEITVLLPLADLPQPCRP